MHTADRYARVRRIAMDAQGSHPIQVVLRDDTLERNRWTVAFRLILAIPLLIWWYLWTLGAVIALPVAWVWALIAGRLPDGLHNFYGAYVRFTSQLHGYMTFATDRYPPFDGSKDYALDVDIAPAAPQSRVKVLFRLLLALPPLILAGALIGGTGGGGGDFDGSRTTGDDGGGFGTLALTGGGALTVIAVLGWFACLARGAVPWGFRDFAVWAIGYGAQAGGYLVLLTDRYPNSMPALARPAGMPEHPVGATLEDDLRRSRLTVAFRLLLALPHVVWLTLWGIVALLAAIANWFATLFVGTSPAALHDFLAAYVRQRAHVLAFVLLAANPFPGFTGAPGSYPLDVQIAPPAPQHRGKTFFRIVLAIPAAWIASAIVWAAFVAAVGGWFASLVTGRMPRGLRDIGAFAVRYSAQLDAYTFLLTDRYPYTGPTLERRRTFLPPSHGGPSRDWQVAPEAM